MLHKVTQFACSMCVYSFLSATAYTDIQEYDCISPKKLHLHLNIVDYTDC